MPHVPAGWYCYCAMNGIDTVAKDLMGPFESRQDVIEWGREWGIAFRENGDAYAKAVLYAGEMTGDESADPWYTAIHRRVGV